MRGLLFLLKFTETFFWFEELAFWELMIKIITSYMQLFEVNLSFLHDLLFEQNTLSEGMQIEKLLLIPMKKTILLWTSKY